MTILEILTLILAFGTGFLFSCILFILFVRKAGTRTANALVRAAVGRAAAQDFCRLLGDAERLMARMCAVWQYIPGSQVTAMTKKAETSKDIESMGILRGISKEPATEGAKMRTWITKMNEMVDHYTDFIGQTPREE